VPAAAARVPIPRPMFPAPTTVTFILSSPPRRLSGRAAVWERAGRPVAASARPVAISARS
jgi:hypothetical protein